MDRTVITSITRVTAKKVKILKCQHKSKSKTGQNLKKPISVARHHQVQQESSKGELQNSRRVGWQMISLRWAALCRRASISMTFSRRPLYSTWLTTLLSCFRRWVSGSSATWIFDPLMFFSKSSWYFAYTFTIIIIIKS